MPAPLFSGLYQLFHDLLKIYAIRTCVLYNNFSTYFLNVNVFLMLFLWFYDSSTRGLPLLVTPYKNLYNNWDERGCLARAPGYFPGDDGSVSQLVLEPPEDVQACI
jgi:hypothetical protein